MFNRKWACYSKNTGLCITYFFKYQAVERAARMEDVSGRTWNVVKLTNRNRHYNSFGLLLAPMSNDVVLSVDEGWISRPRS